MFIYAKHILISLTSFMCIPDSIRTGALAFLKSIIAEGHLWLLIFIVVISACTDILVPSSHVIVVELTLVIKNL